MSLATTSTQDQGSRYGRGDPPALPVQQSTHSGMEYCIRISCGIKQVVNSLGSRQVAKMHLHLAPKQITWR